MGCEQYPYDPRARVEHLVGLEKLRAVADRELAAQLFRLYLHLEAAEADGRAGAWRTRDQKAKEAAELSELQSLAKAAFDGAYGPAAKALAAQMLVDDQTWGRPRRTDLPSLRAFKASLQELRRHP